MFYGSTAFPDMKNLRAPDVPSVLVELGYVSNRQDLQSLVSETWRNRTAESMAQAIETFLSSQMAGGAAGGAHTGAN